LIRFSEAHETEGLLQTSRNGGLLGVPGNIGMSTFLHAFVTERIVGSGNAIVIGDDGAAIGTPETLQRLKTQIQDIGDIADEKFAMTNLARPETKFVKRRVELSQEGLTIDNAIFAFPTGYESLGIEPEGRTIRKVDWIHRAKRQCQVFGGTLWSFLKNRNSLSEKDNCEISKIMRSFYKIFNLPHGGCFPGYLIQFEGQTARCDFVVPPIPGLNYDPSVVDWVEYLLESQPGHFVRIPKTVPDTIKLHELDLLEGSETTCTRSEFTAYLEDIGVAKVEKVMEMVDLGVLENQRRFTRWLKRLGTRKQLVLVTMVRSLDPAVNVEGLCNVGRTDASIVHVGNIE